MADTSRKVRRQLVRWLKKESAYGSQIGDGESGSFVTVHDDAIIKDVPRIGDDSGMMGKGHEFRGNTRQVLAWDANVSLSEWLSSKAAAWGGSFALGSVSTTSLGGGAYRHEMTPLAQSTSVQLPSTTLVEDQPDETLKRKVAGFCVDSYGISGVAGQWCKQTTELVGSGRVDATTSIVVPSLTDVNPLKATQTATFTIGASGAESSEITRLRSFAWKWSNNLLKDRGYQPGATEVNSGPIRSRLEYGVRTMTLEAVIDAKRSSYTEWTAHRGQTLYGFTISIVGPQIGASGQYETVKIEVPDGYFVIDPQDDGDVKVYRLTFDGRYKAANVGPVKFTVISADATLLAAAS